MLEAKAVQDTLGSARLSFPPDRPPCLPAGGDPGLEKVN